MKEMDDLMGALDMIHQDLYYSLAQSNNNLINRKIKIIMKQVSVLIDEIEEISNNSQKTIRDSTLPRKNTNSSPRKKKTYQQSEYKNPKQKTIHNTSKSKNVRGPIKLYNEQGIFKYNKPDYRPRDYEDWK